ncbi:MAG: hypothetical protein ACRCYQ_06295 [Nocardioides sp.]
MPDWLAPHYSRIVVRQEDIARYRWREATGQDSDGAGAGAPDCGVLASGDLVHQALASGERVLAREFATWYFKIRLRAATRELKAALAALEAEVDGTPMSHARLVATAADESDPARAARLAEALAKTRPEARAAREAWMATHHRAVVALGYPSHGVLVRDLYPGVDAAARAAVDFLAESAEDFFGAWGQCRPEGREKRTLRALLGADADPLPGARQPVSAPEAAARTFGRWGFEERLRAVRLDLSSRPGKVGFAFCAPVSVPGDIRVSAFPGGSLRHYATVLHEFAHAVEYAGLPDRLALWHRPAHVSEGVAMALEGLAHDPAWHGWVTGAQIDESLIRSARLAELALPRLLAVSLLHELAVHDGDLRESSTFAVLYRRHLGLDVHPDDSLNRLQLYLEGQPLYPLDYLRAHALASRWRSELWTEAAWFSRPAAGAVVGRLIAAENGEESF